MQDVGGNLIEYLSRIAFPKISIIDVIQIALIAFFVYQFMIWIKYTHAYTLLKGNTGSSPVYSCCCISSK